MTIDFASYLRDVPDFPSEGIIFKDITPLLEAPEALASAIEQLAAFASPLQPDYIMGAESRGFILGGALAHQLGCGLALARKPGKLPRATIRAEYEMEYGTDALELHADSIRPGARVLIHDDLLATGGTAQAKLDLVKQLGAEVVGLAFIVELSFLGGRDRFSSFPLHSLVQVQSE